MLSRILNFCGCSSSWQHGAARVLVVGIGSLALCQSHTREERESQIAQDFSEKINAYLELHRETAAPALKPNNSPEKITSTQHQVTSKIREARGNPKRGDIFTPEISAYFRRQIASSLKGPDGEKIKTSLRHAEPVKDIPIRVNEPYPPDVPLQSTPPTLLQNLPTLPSELEYRIVGNKLILRDSKANLVVDFIPNAISPL